MSQNNIEVKTNFSSVFANLATQQEVREVANIIRDQLVNAVNAREAEIANGATVLSVVAEVTVDADTKPQKGNKSSTTAKAKEAAAKLKTQSKKTKSAPEPKAESAASDDTLIAITDTANIKKLGLKFEVYNERCWVLRGNTKPLRKVLKEQFKGVYNSRLTGGEGWVFSTANAQECAKALGLKVKAA